MGSTTGYTDTFARTVSGGLGTATSGQAYTVNGTASQYSVAIGPPGTASIAATALGERYGNIDLQTQDADLSGQVALSAIPVTNLATAGFQAKMSPNNYYVGSMMVAAGGAISLRFSKVIGGGLSTISTTATGLTYVAGTYYNLHYTITWSQALQTNVMRLKLWAIGATEPGGWMATATDASLTQYTSGTRIGIHHRDESTVSGALIARYRSVSSRSYALPMPASTDQMCQAPGATSSDYCTIAVADGSFESGDPVADGWFVQNGTLDGDTAFSHTGAWSARVTVVGTPGQTNFRNSKNPPVVAGTLLLGEQWVYSSDDATFTASIDYYDAGFGYLTSTLTNFAVRAHTWTRITAANTTGAPATTAFVQYGVTIFSPPAGLIFWVDDADILAPCTVTALTYPDETWLEVLAEAADTAMAALDPLISLAGLFPRVRISNTNLVINTAAIAINVPFIATEYNVSTPTNLGYDNTGVYLGVGIWLATFEIQLKEAASDFLLVSFGSAAESVTIDMRSNAVQTNDQGVGGCAHVTKMISVTDPTTSVKVSATLGPNNVATTYTASYVAMSAIKISDYFA